MPAFNPIPLKDYPGQWKSLNGHATVQGKLVVLAGQYREYGRKEFLVKTCGIASKDSDFRRQHDGFQAYESEVRQLLQDSARYAMTDRQKALLTALHQQLADEVAYWSKGGACEQDFKAIIDVQAAPYRRKLAALAAAVPERLKPLRPLCTGLTEGLKLTAHCLSLDDMPVDECKQHIDGLKKLMSLLVGAMDAADQLRAGIETLGMSSKAYLAASEWNIETRALAEALEFAKQTRRQVEPDIEECEKVYLQYSRTEGDLKSRLVHPSADFAALLATLSTRFGKLREQATSAVREVGAALQLGGPDSHQPPRITMQVKALKEAATAFGDELHTMESHNKLLQAVLLQARTGHWGVLGNGTSPMVDAAARIIMGAGLVRLRSEFEPIRKQADEYLLKMPAEAPAHQ